MGLLDRPPQQRSADASAPHRGWTIPLAAASSAPRLIPAAATSVASGSRRPMVRSRSSRDPNIVSPANIGNPRRGPGMLQQGVAAQTDLHGSARPGSDMSPQVPRRTLCALRSLASRSSYEGHSSPQADRHMRSLQRVAGFPDVTLTGLRDERLSDSPAGSSPRGARDDLVRRLGWLYRGQACVDGRLSMRRRRSRLVWRRRFPVGGEVSQPVILLTCVSRCSVEWWTRSGLAALLWETS